MTNDPASPTTSDVDAARLATIISPLRRALHQASRAAGSLPELPESHIQVIRALLGGAAQAPSELAETLRLDRSTVSNLLASMERAGLIVRTPSPTDRRRVLVSPSPRAHEIFHAYDASGSAILDDALAALSTGERSAIAVALPALEQLTRTLHAQRPR